MLHSMLRFRQNEESNIQSAIYTLVNATQNVSIDKSLISYIGEKMKNKMSYM